MTEAAVVDVARLDDLLRPYDRTDSPGFALGVAVNGQPRYRRGVGLASVELPVALSPSIRMRIGSTTKHFCVLAIMLLQEEGKLSIDDSPRKHLPELPAWADAMTLRQLMSHTSGMRDSLDLILQSAGPGQAAAPDYQLKLLSALDSVNFAPGSSWSYNNGGYVLLSEIVQRVSGEPFADHLQARIFDPVGMYDTLVRPLDTDLLPNSATLHVPRPDGGWTRGVFGAPILGEGGMVSTVDDMLLWLRHMNAPTVGSPETWAAMRTPATTHGYGLGLFMDKRRGLDTVHHAGGVVGGCSQMMKVLGPDLDITIMSNGPNALALYGLLDGVIDACIPGLPPAATDVAGAPVSGLFYSKATGRALTLVDADGKQAVAFGPMVLPARRDEDGAITVDLLPSDMALRPLGEGDGITAIVVTEFGAEDRLERTEPPAQAHPQAIAGAYESLAASITAVVSMDIEGAAHLRMAGPLGGVDYVLKAVGEGLWQATATQAVPIGGLLEFDAEGFAFSSGRTSRLRFTRVA